MLAVDPVESRIALSVTLSLSNKGSREAATTRRARNQHHLIDKFMNTRAIGVMMFGEIMYILRS